jgi:hypothetical protein
MSAPHARAIAPLFIIGSPRSGTTMLAQLLADSPWGEPFETHFIPKYCRVAARLGSLSNREAFLRVARQILDERPIRQRQLDIDLDRLFDSRTSWTYAQLANEIGLASARKHGHPSWGDKTPDYITDVALLHELFPDSKMIYIVRDGRDVALSLMRESWGPANVYTCATKWARENRPGGIEAVRAKSLLHEVRYEELLHDPATVLARVLTFLECEVTQERIRGLASTVNRHNCDKWKYEMTAAHIELFEQVAGDTLRQFGYQVGAAPRAVGAVRAMTYRAHNSWKHWRNLFVMNVVDTIRIGWLGKEPFAG